MTTPIKLTLKYGEQRRALLLNANNKDDYGRHRGHVLYGMKLTADGASTNLKIGSGAVYTAQGQRLYWEDSDATVALASAFSASPKPVCVLVYLYYAFATATIPTSVEYDTSAAAQAENAYIRWRVSPYDRSTGAPVYDIDPVVPVDLNTSAAGADVGANSITPATYVDLPGSAVGNPTPGAADTRLNFGEIPLGYVLIGGDGSTAATNLQSAGVSIVSYRNAFETLSDLLGADALIPRQPGDVNSTTPNTGTALTQALSAYNVGGGGTTAPLRHPHYGTPAPTGTMPGPPNSGVPANADFLSDFTTYRQPNFLRDGDSVLDALRRLDFLVRLVADMSGNQSVVGLTQDNSAGLTNMLKQAPLAQLVQAFTGATDLTNHLLAVYDNAASGANPTNHVIRAGVLPHVENGRTTKATDEGDSLRMAISALDYAFFQLTTNILGYSATRSQWRDTTPATTISDGPRANNTLLADPTLTGASVSSYLDTIYLANETLFAGVDKLAERTYGSSQNLLSNPCFVHDATGVLGTPAVTAWSASATQWAVEHIDPGFPLPQHVLHLTGTNRAAAAEVRLVDSNGSIGQALLANTIVGAAVTLISSNASSVRIAFCDSTQAELFGANIPAAVYSGWTHVAFAVRTKAMPVNVAMIRLIIDGAVSSGDTYITGAWLGFGLPPIIEHAPSATPWLSRTNPEEMLAPIVLPATAMSGNQAARVNDVTGLIATESSLTMKKASNLSDVASASTSRTNLGLGTAATHDVPPSGDASASQVVLGNDSRLLRASYLALATRSVQDTSFGAGDNNSEIVFGSTVHALSAVLDGAARLVGTLNTHTDAMMVMEAFGSVPATEARWFAVRRAFYQYDGAGVATNVQLCGTIGTNTPADATGVETTYTIPVDNAWTSIAHFTSAGGAGWIRARVSGNVIYLAFRANTNSTSRFITDVFFTALAVK